MLAIRQGNVAQRSYDGSAVDLSRLVLARCTSGVIHRCREVGLAIVMSRLLGSIG